MINPEELDLVLEEARLVTTTSDRLLELTQLNNLAICKAIATNSNTPTQALFQLAGDFPEQFLANLIVDLLFLGEGSFPIELPTKALLSLLSLELVPNSVIE